MIMIGRWGTGENCGQRDNCQQRGRQRPTHTGATVSDTEISVSVTGFSVTLTGKTVAESVADECRFRPALRRYAAICSAATLHVFSRKIHVVGQVCNK